MFIEVKNDNATIEDDDMPDIENEPGPVVATLPVDVVEVPKDSIEEPFRFVEKMPEPEGGMQGFYKSLKKNLKYPAAARHKGTDGKVFVEFTVTRHGTLDNFKVIKGIGDGCDDEAIRVIKLTKWKAGKQRGVPVNVRLVQTIYFSLQ
ncbi:MAG: energy transducer TonB [Bacteroidia bacterium]|nr:energy transducer TonB [Bacteroidia bacterium]